MISCITEETLSAYCDGVLDKSEQRLVEEHLEQCWRCRRIESDYRALSAKIKQLPDFEVPAGLKNNIFTALEQDTSQKLKVDRRLWLRTAVAAVLLIAFAVPGYALFSRKQVSESQSSLNIAAGGSALESADKTVDKSIAQEDAVKKKGDVQKAQGESSVNVQQSLKGGAYSASLAPEKEVNVKLEVADPESASRALLTEINEFAGVSKIEVDLESNPMKFTITMPDSEIMSFLARLEAIGKVTNGNFTSNIGEQGGTTVLNIYMRKS